MTRAVKYFIITISIAAFLILKKRTETPIMPPFYHGILITNVKMQLLSEVGSLLYSAGLTLIDGSNI